MRKRMKRLFAFLVAIMLVVGSINVNLLTTYAADVIERDYTYSFAQLVEKTGGWGNSHSIDDTTGALSVTFHSQYGEVLYALPDALVGKKVLKVTLNGVVGDNSQFNLKQYSTNWDENYAAGGSNVITVKDEVNAIGFGGFGIQGKAADVTVSVESVTFTVEEENTSTDPVPVEGTYTITVYASALTCDWHTTTTAELNDEKRFNIEFSDASYNEARLVLPENLKINMADCESITFNVSEQDGPVNFCAWNGTSSKVMDFYYNTGKTSYILTNTEYTGEFDGVGVQIGSDTTTKCVLDSVVFTMNKKTAEDTDVVYGEAPVESAPVEGTYTITVYASALTCDWHNTTTAELNDEKRFNIEFSDASYNEARLVLPENLKINMPDCESITFNVNEQDGPVNFCAWNGTSNKVMDFYYKTGQTSYVVTNTEYTGEFDGVGVQIGSDTTTKCVLDSVVFTMNKKTAEDTDVVYGEAPVESAPVEGTYTITVYASALTCDWHSTTTAELNDEKRFNIEFSDASYNEARLVLPENLKINMADCESITFNVNEQDGPVNFCAWDGTSKVMNFYYNTGKTSYILTNTEYTGEFDGVGVQIGSDTTTKCVLDSVVFTMNKKTAEDADVVYGEAPVESAPVEGTYTITVYASALTCDWHSTTTAELNDEKRFNIEFSDASYNEARLVLPENLKINMADCESITFNVSEQDGPVNFCAWNGTSNKVMDFYYKTGQTSYVVTSTEYTGEFDGVGVQIGSATTTKCVLDSVVFTMNKKTAEDTDVVYGEAPVESAPVEGTYTITVYASALTCDWHSTTTAELNDEKRFNIEFSDASYNEARLVLPENLKINMSDCESITFNVSEQDGPVNFCAWNGTSSKVMDFYYNTGKTSYILTNTEYTGEFDGVGVQIGSATTTKCVLDSVVFTMNKKTAEDTDVVYGELPLDVVEETYTITYSAEDLVQKSSQAEICELVNGKYQISFSAADQNVNFKLPATINLEKCKNIIVTVASQTGPMNFNVGLDNSKLKDYWYNIDNTTYTLIPGITNKINEFGIQCGRENDAFVEGAAIELVSVSFLMKGKEPKDPPADHNYSIDYFEVESKTNDVSIVFDEEGVATVTFPNAGDRIVFAIPDSVDINHLVSIDFHMTAVTGGISLFNLRSVTVPEILIEIMNTDSTQITSTLTDHVDTNCNPEVRLIAFTSNTANTVLSLSSIQFNIDPAAFEAIVLNGNFARTDISMWGAALWGSVDDVDTAITLKTASAPIFDDIYTYGELNRRSSPYVCFAQNVSDRVEANHGYAFSFWAKLSDDYIGAPTDQRMIEFSPYYFDANGNENYNMTRTGSYRQVLEPGVWTYFSGVVGLPAGSQGMVIRIVEQGTNYGQGDCVLGGYSVTGVKLEPSSYPTVPSNNDSGSSAPVITKTATCEVSYEFEKLPIDWASGSANKSDTFQKISFVNKYDEVRMKLPRTLDMSTCAYIYTNVTGQNVPIAVKLYYKGKQVDVSYYNNINSSYLMVPEYTGMIDAIGIMSLADPNPADAYVQVDSIRFGLTQEPAPEKVSDSIVLNGDFADEDLSDWCEALWGDGVTITRNISDKPITGNIKTYATYSKRTSPYQCFAQDITGRVAQNSTYKVSFWAKLSDDYKNAPAEQRIVQFAPYTVDMDGNPDYNPKLSGNLAIALKPGEWTYFEGTYKVTNANPISKVVIRILEQGTNYGQGDCVMGSFSIADVRIEKYIPVPPEIDEDVPNLKDVLTEIFGEDFIAGTALTLDGLDDPGHELLINKHFNAITLGNELKPDALFGYSNNKHTQLKTAIINGKSIQVPTLNFSRADELLNGILRWNESHSETPFKIRGHVLVWHSQTPEWFFRENYTVAQRADGSENYVTPEVMNLRLEWYIKSVLEHYTGAKSPYKDLFYGWDVVNEAVSDNGNGYRTEKNTVLETLSQSTHSSNSSWWAVYHSNEFIINAFRYANQYAPADLELYYNDYNECESKKVKGIVELLKAVKEAEGTRIDGMGMQGHYRTNSPKIADIENAIRAYSAVVGKVQLTELDLKASQDITYKAAQADEYQKQAKYYHDIFQLLQKLNAEDDITIGGITFWGVTDSGSWLQNGSTVGGGSDGLLPQCPLLFDAFYRVKPAFWAFVDYTMVDPDWNKEASEDNLTSDTESTEKNNTEESSEETDVSNAENSSEEAKTDDSADVSSDAVQKGSPVLPVAIAVGAVLAAGGSGTALFIKKRKKK